MGQAIVVMGIFVADAAFTAPRLPRLGETLLGSGFALGPGGKGSNQAIAAARAGGQAHFITRLGQDAFATMAQQIWAEAGVVPHVTVGQTPTGAAFIYLEEGSGQNAIIVAAGAAADITSEDLTTRGDLFAQAAVFLTQLEAPLAAVEAGLQAARSAGVFTILNPAPAAPLSDDLLALCDLVTPNETEAEGLTGVGVAGPDTARTAARALRARGAGGVIVTLGGQGLWLDADGEACHVPARAAGPVRDTTGAGDAFNGALAVALAEGADIRAAAEFANAAAALSVTRAGAGGAMATRAEIDALRTRG
jgi:ribokinase